MLDLDEDVVFECIVDGKNDFATDSIYFTEPQNEFFDIHIYQIKYSSNLQKDPGIKENDIIKMIESVKKIFTLQKYDINNKLHQKLVDMGQANIDNSLEWFQSDEFMKFYNKSLKK